MVTGYRTIDSLYPSSDNTYNAPGEKVGGMPGRSEHINQLKLRNNLNIHENNHHPDTGLRPMTSEQAADGLLAAECAGINTTFPGLSEYSSRYTAPRQSSRVTDLTINPTPNMGIHGRPLGQALYQPSFTEYDMRYDWPDGEKIVRLPWIRT